MPRGLAGEVEKVVVNGNCSGCGACGLVSRRIEFALDAEGYMRPTVRSEPDSSGPPPSDAAEAGMFRAVCPGVGVTAPRLPEGSHRDPVLGSYIACWKGWATDPAVRYAGSSGGVLTALAIWLVETGRVRSVGAVGSSASQPDRTVPVQIVDRDSALEASGSRYAPVASVARTGFSSSDYAAVGKPCEVSALRAASRTESLGHDAILLSFLCAGVPSQVTTDELIGLLDVSPESVTALRYRGDGWPGRFTVKSGDGSVASLSYEKSWGDHLGKSLQWRCKLCVDATGGDADIAVGDYWRSDDAGFPIFDDEEGVSSVIARTSRGVELLSAAERDGVLHLEPLTIQAAAGVQPFQRLRRVTLAGRLFGRLLGGKRIPRYRGYGLLRLAMENVPSNCRACLGTLRRTLQKR